ncbi:hypothetical protein C8J56DRAFT_919735 [Mycena floridula]|nr:hypothetical protein C8J56DRAFT_919735 [Mycena floridula]
MPPLPSWPMPKLNFQILDLDHPGAEIFLKDVHPAQAMRIAVEASFKFLYKTVDLAPTNVKEILLVLKSMPGVAYCFGSESKKEIHFSLDHINNSKDRAKDEIMGVLVHEVVHCYQYNGNGTAPSGLIEGVADYVRMLADLSPPHWANSFPPKEDDRWDGGYQVTAFFLKFLDDRYGDGTVRELNEMLKEDEYHKSMWKQLTGRKIKKLWRIYLAESNKWQPAADSADDSDEDMVLINPADIS